MAFELRGIGIDLFWAEKVLKKSPSFNQVCKFVGVNGSY